MQDMPTLIERKRNQVTHLWGDDKNERREGCAPSRPFRTEGVPCQRVRDPSRGRKPDAAVVRARPFQSPTGELF